MKKILSIFAAFAALEISLAAAPSGTQTPAPAAPAPALSPVELRTSFAAALAAVLSEFEELDSPRVTVRVVEAGTPKATVEISVTGGFSHEAAIEALGLAVANFALKYPGIRYASAGEDAWRLVIPEKLELPADGVFNVEIP